MNICYKIKAWREKVQKENSSVENSMQKNLNKHTENTITQFNQIYSGITLGRTCRDLHLWYLGRNPGWLRARQAS